jgi:hypothetical protein
MFSQPYSGTRRSFHARRAALAFVALALVAPACGGDDDFGANEFEQLNDGLDDADDIIGDADDIIGDALDEGSGGSSNSPLPDGFDFGDDFPTSDGLIPELAGFPIPPGTVFGVGSANPADVDPRQTAIQQVYFTISLEDAVSFYLEELPKAGYDVKTESSSTPADAAGGNGFILFDRPDGNPGQITMGVGTDSTSSININVFLSGIR